MVLTSWPDMLRTIRDPEKPSTLEDLKVVYEDGIFIQPPTDDNVQVVKKMQCIYVLQFIHIEIFVLNKIGSG